MDTGKESRKLATKTALPLAALFVLVCVIAAYGTSFVRAKQVLASEGQVAHTFQVKGQVESIYGTVAAAESDHRAYILTGDADALKRYEASRPSFEAQLEELRKLTKDNPSQRSPIERLESAIQTRYVYMDSSARNYRQIGQQGAIDLIKQGNGFRAMEDVRKAIADIQDAETVLLRERQTQSLNHLTQAELTFGFTLITSILLIGAFAVLSYRLVSLRDKAAAEERAFRAELELEVTRTREAELRLEALTIELQRSNEELQNFAFVASHDLQEPLRKIRAFADRVRRRCETVLDDESKDSLQRVEAAAERMQRLILDLLDLSRVTTKGRPSLEVSLATAVEEVVDDLQTRLEETGGKVECIEMATVVVDPAQLRQLLQNLIANALKFRREGVAPVVSIKAKDRGDGRVDIEVSDNGIGFEPRHAERIFVVFQRLHGRGEYEGSGIGLAIVRKIVERHGGSIVADGSPEFGATFRFDLPGLPPKEKKISGRNKHG